eukprot:TRINITY_DN8185_c0_g1_i1.p1 TRINITY_DN8185_c0_g1~~TRINITY_DN8185_c0_g1_i1.p1  ORF type:complete len:255 (+),score=25.05 TRINITY_DN8185_c0_g1_i1:40-804(+)
MAGVTETPLIFESKRKAKSYWFPQRDSLAHRRKHGKPGSRRYQRYLNASYLNDADFWDASVCEILQQQRLMMWCPEFRNYFQYIWENEENFSLWRPFVDITEDDQSRLLQQLSPAPQLSAIDDATEAKRLFFMIGKDSRKMLKDPVHKALLLEMESKIIEAFALEESPSLSKGAADHLFEDLSLTNGELRFMMDDSRCRRIVHAVCKYYSLNSSTISTENCKRLVVVKKRKRHANVVLPLPNLILSAYLELISS